MASRLAIVGGAVVTPREVIKPGIVLCEDGRISFAGRAGAAAPEEGIRDPNLEECRELLAAAPHGIKIMTLAPELPGGLDLIRLLTSAGVIASLGHSEADYETALAAIEA